MHSGSYTDKGKSIALPALGAIALTGVCAAASSQILCISPQPDGSYETLYIEDVIMDG
jgi:hypothetical protein